MNKDDKIMNILAAIAKMSPSYAQEHSGDIHCFYCYAWLECGEEHDADCLYIKICKLLNIEPLE